MKCKYGMGDGKERAGWSTRGGAGCPEWMTVPKDLVRLKALSLPCFSSFHPCSKMTTLKIQLVSAGASALKSNAGISGVELVTVRWRAWGCLPLFNAHCSYFCYSLPEKVGGGRRMFWRKRNSLPPKTEWGRAHPCKYLIPHLTSRQTVSFPSTTSRSYLVPLCCASGLRWLPRI